MKMLPPVSIAFLLMLQANAAVAASPIYRCVGADGVVKFQDSACQTGESSRRIELPDTPSIPDAAPPPRAADTLATPPRSGVQRDVTRATGFAADEMLCMREDGSRYLSESGHGEQHAVPLGVLGIPGDSLADAYGGRDGIGVSAPGLREPPVDHSRDAQVGAMLTWVEDPCIRIDEVQLCAFIADRIADAERRLRLAFSDTRDQVRSDLEGWRERADRCAR